MRFAGFRCFAVSCISCFWLMRAPAARADEGMWLFNYPPKKLLKEKHDFVPTDDGWRTCSSRPCGSTTAAPGRSFRPTAW